MSHIITEDAVLYALGESERRDFEKYHGKTFAELRKYYYAIFMHGDKFGAYIYDDPHNFAPILKGWYNKYGKGRSVLLITCWAGWTFARPLAVNTKIPILAALAPVSFATDLTGNKQTYIQVADEISMELHGNKDKKYKSEWVYYHPSGTRETLAGGHKLDQAEAIKMAKKYST